VKRKKLLASLEALIKPAISLNNSGLGKPREFSRIAGDLTQ
jgi:hypothetical protein